jgi:cellulose synthase (UDP-forming)
LFQSDHKPSRTRSILWLLVLPIAFSILAFFLTLPLRWKDQAVLGCLLIASAMVTNRFLSHRVATLFLSLSACFCTARYAYYRYSETIWNFRTSWSQIQTIDAAFVVLLLFAETYSFVILFLGCIQTSRPLKRRPIPLPDDSSSWPTVDVFIPTYNEPLDVVAPTVLAALTMDYPKDKFKVYILDDGRRSPFADFAAECGATYVTRADNAHAKAGNINAAAKNTTGEYVTIFDCDHVPTRSFLQMTMGAMVADPKLGMIQTPHHFYSPDPFERNLKTFRKVPNESALFYGIIQDGNDLWDATFFCGSCAVLRRTALEEIGGIAVETVTEDAHTALRMHSAGWSTAYLNLPQAAGLATSRLSDHVGQRIRWARGMVQILRIDNPLFKRGLRLPQRLCYLNAMLHYLFSGPRFIFILSPLVYLILGRSNVFGYLPGILAYGLPHIFLSTLVNSRIQGKHRHSFWNEVYEVVLAPYIFLPTALALVNPKWGKFNVTAKDSVIAGAHFDWQIAKPFAFLLLLTATGMAMGFHRMWLEGDPQGVLTVNLVWAFFNATTIAAAMAVASERKQVRTTVRVATALSVKLLLPNGETVTGRTDDVSLGGVVARLMRSDVMERGDAARITISLGTDEYTFPVIATFSSGSVLRLRFGTLDMGQQAMLTRVIFGRADCWLRWRSEYEKDRPMLNVIRITGFALHGIGAAIRSLVPIGKEPKKLKSANNEQIALPVLAALLLLPLAGSAKAQVSAQPVGIPASAPSLMTTINNPAPWFRDVRDLASLGYRQGSMLRGSNGRFALHFGVPMTKMVLQAGLTFRYRVSAQFASGSKIHVKLNGSPAGTLVLPTEANGSAIQQADLALAPDLFVGDNTLNFDLEAKCGAECTDSQTSLWVEIHNSTEIQTAGTLLPVPNRLSYLPAPFITSGTQRLVDLPFVVDENSDALTKQAAGIVASWFGMKADHQAVRFPVSEGRFPAGNVVLIATPHSPMAAALGVGGVMPSVSIRNNPSDPYGKVLAIVAESGSALVDAARAFALERYSRENDSSLLSISDLPSARVPYDAPRWIDTSREVRLAERMSDSQLEVKGTGSVHLYFRLPPDLYYGTRDTVPFHLRYRSSALAAGSKAHTRLHLNGQLITTRAIPTGTQTDIHEEIVYLPVASIYPRNTLTVEFVYDSVRLSDDRVSVPEAAVLKSSELMVKGMPHFAAMPRLDMLANTGFPYTRFADLSETLVLLPPSPTSDETSLYLTMAGFMGAQTGYPALQIEVAQEAVSPGRANKDILLIGGLDRQPILQKWAEYMLVQPSGRRFRLADTFSLTSMLSRLPWTDSLSQRRNLELILANDSKVDAIVQGFASPLHEGRTVVAFTSMPAKSFASLAEDWATVADASKMHGTVSLFNGGRFHSFTVESDRYHMGELARWAAMQYWGRHYYWLSPIAIFACLWLFTLFCDRWLEKRASDRLRPRSLMHGVSNVSGA